MVHVIVSSLQSPSFDPIFEEGLVVILLKGHPKLSLKPVSMYYYIAPLSVHF